MIAFGDHRSTSRCATSSASRARAWKRIAVLVDRRPRRCSCCIIVVGLFAVLRARRAHGPRSTSARRRRGSDFIFALTAWRRSRSPAWSPRRGWRARWRWAAAGSSGWSSSAAACRPRRLRGHRARRPHRAAGRGRQTELAAPDYLEAPVARDRRGASTPQWLADGAEVRRRGGRDGDADRGVELGDARALAPGLLAVDQPPDPQRARAAAPDALDAVRAHRDRRGDRRGARRARGPRLPRRHLRVRRAARRSRIAHVSIIALRFREPDRTGPYRMPLSIPCAAATLAAARACSARSCSACAFSVARHPARGRALRRPGVDGVRPRCSTSSTAPPRTSRCSSGVVVPEEALRRRGRGARVRIDPRAAASARRWTTTSSRPPAAWPPRSTRRGFDDTRARRSRRSGCSRSRWRCRSTPRLPDAQLEQARAALRRAKAVGEEYEGVEVRDRDRPRAPGRPGDRRGGAAARREAIVLGAEEPSRIRGGARLGGRGGPLENFVGDVTKYVIARRRAT